MPKQTENLEELHVGDLRERAKEAGISGTSHMRKDQLVEVLRHDDAEPSKRGAKAGKATAPPVDVLTLLINDHENVKALFKEALAKDAGDASMQDLATQIIAELKLHTEAEETIFYPALKAKALDDEVEDAKDGVLEAYVEHGSVKELIARIEGMAVDDESYKAVLQVMSEQIEHHVEEEESEMFKQARELLSQDDLLSIGEQIAVLKESAGATK